MTEREKADIFIKAHALHEAGREAESIALQKTIPMPPFLAKIAKEKVGTDYLLTSGWNLTEAEAEFGQDWLTR